MATASGGGCCAGAGGSQTRSTAALLAAVLAATLLMHGVDADSCHWCGPAAEQVHRSRRPPPCRAPLDPAQVISCEPSHPYCATVATTPPYTESRICIKHNKEACYPRFCNTSNTWRMTCTCQGNLCNGEKDDRVVEAFAKLAKHNVSITTTTKAATATVPTSTVGVPENVTAAASKHEFHNAHEMNSLWTTSSESEMAERLPAAAALHGGESGGGGGEDDEDALEGSGAALRSDSPRPLDTERTTQLSRHRSTETPESREIQENSAAIIKTAHVASIAAIAIYVLT